MKISGVILGFALVASAYAQVLPPHCIVAGKTIEDWTMLSYKYCMPQPLNEAPYLAPEGNPVLYISGASVQGETHVVRQYSIPENKYLLIPLLVAFYVHSSPDVNPNEMRNELNTWYEPPPILYFSVNGTPADNLLQQRVSTPALTVDLIDPNNQLTETFHATYTGIWTIVVEGYWIMLEPLPVGTNVVEFGGAYNMPGAYWFSRTDTIIVEPISPQQWIAEFIPVAQQALPAEPFLTPLKQAQGSFQNGNLHAGLGQLAEFQKQLQKAAKQVRPAIVDSLRRYSQRIIEQANKAQGKQWIPKAQGQSGQESIQSLPTK